MGYGKCVCIEVSNDKYMYSHITKHAYCTLTTLYQLLYSGYIYTHTLVSSMYSSKLFTVQYGKNNQPAMKKKLPFLARNIRDPQGYTCVYMHNNYNIHHKDTHSIILL